LTSPRCDLRPDFAAESACLSDSSSFAYPARYISPAWKGGKSGRNGIGVIFPTNKEIVRSSTERYRRRTACVSNSTRERLCERKRTNCELGSPLCLAIMINDVPQRSHNREPVRRPARANRSGIHDSSGLNRPLKRLLCRLWFRCVDAWARIGSDTIARPWPSRSS
jgi:hypothetical protein